MSKFLKVIVNTILFLAIVVAGGLLIPPFAGVTTVIVDDTNMETNLARGSVTYALNKDSSQLKTGNKILVYDGDGQYVYEVTGVNSEAISVEDKLSVDGQTKELPAGSSIKKVLFTVPFIGYVTMALGTTEGIIIVGLVVVFVIILFILAEIWKKDEDEDDEDETDDVDPDEENDDEEEAEEEPVMSRRDRKKARKEAKRNAKEEKKALKAAAKAKKKQSDEDEAEEPESRQDIHALESGIGDEFEDSRITEEDKKLFEETGNFFAASIADLMGEQHEEAAAAKDYGCETKTSDEIRNQQTEEAAPENETAYGRRMAIPVYTKEELLEKARAAGEEPDVVEDDNSGITFLDYSDIL
ncbi:MAG: hypothetical protein PUF14_00970 [Clostridiales bacterium]|nr:hypothetical protein [Clostridiales bacterium]